MDKSRKKFRLMIIVGSQYVNEMSASISKGLKEFMSSSSISGFVLYLIQVEYILALLLSIESGVKLVQYKYF